MDCFTSFTRLVGCRGCSPAQSSVSAAWGRCEGCSSTHKFEQHAWNLILAMSVAQLLCFCALCSSYPLRSGSLQGIDLLHLLETCWLHNRFIFPQSPQALWCLGAAAHLDNISGNFTSLNSTINEAVVTLTKNKQTNTKPQPIRNVPELWDVLC